MGVGHGGGAKPKPRELKVLAGTLRPDRDNPDAPEPSPDLPQPPAYLTVLERKAFLILRSRLEEIKIASKSHTEMLALAARELATVEELARFIAKEGRTYRTKGRGKHATWMTRTRPEVAQLQEASRRLAIYLGEFGLSPASSVRVKVPAKGSKKKGSGGWQDL
jgi:hypothetical protein